MKNIEQEREFTGVWIPRHVIEDEILSTNDKVIYFEIACFNICRKSNEELGERHELKKHTVSVSISRLINIGYVQSNKKTGKYRELIALKDRPKKTYVQKIKT